MATLRERVRARREAERRKPRSFTIGVSEDDLRAIAERGYGGATSTDQDQRAKAISLFITDILAADRPANGARRLQRRFSSDAITDATSFQLTEKDR